jgi:hypothetical protein
VSSLSVPFRVVLGLFFNDVDCILVDFLRADFSEPNLLRSLIALKAALAFAFALISLS